jgi:hypothetical protein
VSSIKFSWICDAGLWNHICVIQVILCLKILNGEICKGHPKNKDCLSIKKNKQNKNKFTISLLQPEVIFLHSRHEHSGTFHSM